MKNLNIRSYIDNKKPLVLKSSSMNQKALDRVLSCVHQYLKILGVEHIKDEIDYCMQELISNAKKANLKRVFFQDIGLDIDNPAHYEEGMGQFKDKVYPAIEYYEDLMDKAGLYIRFIICSDEEVLKIHIGNNVLIQAEEEKRINKRLESAREFGSIQEAMTSVMDDVEGAGLGLIISTLFLRRIGLRGNPLKIKKNEEETLVSLLLPRSQIMSEKIQIITNELSKEIERIPAFPEHIMKLQELTADPDASFKKIANEILKDPALTADILKNVNSAQYMLPDPISNVEEAVKLIGMKTLRSLLFYSGAKKIFNELFGGQENFWKESNQIAAYINFLSEKLGVRQQAGEFHVIALLHGLGRMLLQYLHPDTLELIETYTVERGLDQKLFEECTMGMYHAEIGAQIAEKWNFPDMLITTIRFQDLPEEAPFEFRPICRMLYLAKVFYAYFYKEFPFNQIKAPVLKAYKLNEEDFQKLQDKFLQLELETSSEKS